MKSLSETLGLSDASTVQIDSAQLQFIPWAESLQEVSSHHPHSAADLPPASAAAVCPPPALPQSALWATLRAQDESESLHTVAATLRFTNGS